MPYWLKAVIFYIGALLLLRIAGKRAVSRKAPIELVVMIALGTLLVHPLKSHNVVISLYGGFLLICGLLILSWLQIHLPATKRWLMGEPLLLIKEGSLIPHNLKRAKMTLDELNMRLRLNKIDSITKIKTATLEVSGDLGIEFYPDQSVATKKDIKELKEALEVIAKHLNVNININSSQNNNQDNVFDSVDKLQNKDPFDQKLL